MDYSSITEIFIRRFAVLMKLGRPRRYGSFTRGEMLLLNYLADHEKPAQAGELCAVMEASSARVAAALGSLEAKGRIARTVDPEDRRRVLVSITDAGREQVTAGRAEMNAYFTRLLCELGEEDAREGLRILGRIMQIAERLEAAPEAVPDKPLLSHQEKQNRFSGS